MCCLYNDRRYTWKPVRGKEIVYVRHFAFPNFITDVRVTLKESKKFYWTVSFDSSSKYFLGKRTISFEKGSVVREKDHRTCKKLKVLIDFEKPNTFCLTQYRNFLRKWNSTEKNIRPEVCIAFLWHLTLTDMAQNVYPFSPFTSQMVNPQRKHT